jgi:hypothetical protein
MSRQAHERKAASSPTQWIEGDFASVAIAANDEQVLARCRVVLRWMIGQPAIADVHSVHNCQFQRSATLDHEPAHVRPYGTPRVIRNRPRTQLPHFGSHNTPSFGDRERGIYVRYRGASRKTCARYERPATR